jgi:pteridine reductase
MIVSGNQSGMNIITHYFTMITGKQTMNKVLLVTGIGAKRLGWHVACEAAKRGYSLALQYRNSRKEAEQLCQDLSRFDIDVRTFQADFSKKGESSRLIEKVYSSFNALDALVHCAAPWPKQSLEETSEDFLLQSLQDICVSNFMLSKEAGLNMCKSSHGGVIVLVGDWAVCSPYLDYSAYFCAKGAIDTQVRVLAKELASRNSSVRINVLHPGPLAVPDNISREEKEQIISKTLLKRLGNPEHFVSGVFFLIENNFVTGTGITIDGGRSIF